MSIRTSNRWNMVAPGSPAIESPSPTRIHEGVQGFVMRAIQSCAKFAKTADKSSPMSMQWPDIRLTGATVLRDGEFQTRSVAIESGCIGRGPFPEIDLTGYYIMPGIIDLHGDAFERQ